MSLNDHFKKKKVKRSRGSMTRATVNANASTNATAASESDSAALAFDMCLSALKVSSEKAREAKFMMPPTPLGSPIHAHTRVMKRARFGSCSLDEECELPACAVDADAAGSALVLLSNRLEDELDLLQKREWKRTKKSHQQLGFYAITTAFHRAFAERNAPKPCAAVSE